MSNVKCQNFKISKYQQNVRVTHMKYKNLYMLCQNVNIKYQHYVSVKCQHCQCQISNIECKTVNIMSRSKCQIVKM